MPNYAISNNILSLAHSTLHYLNNLLAISNIDVHIRLSQDRIRGYGTTFISQDLAFVNSLSNIHFFEFSSLERQNGRAFTTLTPHDFVLTDANAITDAVRSVSNDLFVKFTRLLSEITMANNVRTIVGNLLGIDLTGKTVTDGSGFLIVGKTDDPQIAPTVWAKRMLSTSAFHVFLTHISGALTTMSDSDNVFMQFLLGSLGNRALSLTPSNLFVSDTLIKTYDEVVTQNTVDAFEKENFFFIDVDTDYAFSDSYSPNEWGGPRHFYPNNYYRVFAGVPIAYLKQKGIVFAKCAVSGYYITDTGSSNLFFYNRHERIRDENGDWIIVSYAYGLEQDLLFCSICGTRSLMLRRDAHTHICSFCRTTLSDYDIDSSGVNSISIESYNYEPDNVTLLHKTQDSNTLHLGVELEVDRGGESNINATLATHILSKGNNVWVTHDGSLDEGFEIVTFPATLELHMDKHMFNYTKMFDFLISKGYKSHDAGTCGLHVHIDRSFFGSSNGDKLYGGAKMAYIMEHLWDDFVLFSRRRYSALDHWAKKKDLTSIVDSHTEKGNVISHFNDKYGFDKYLAINTLHTHTFELRIFRGTLNATTYLATLQFVDNFARIARSTPFDALPLITFEDIINYQHYDELALYWAKRKGTTTTNTANTIAVAV